MVVETVFCRRISMRMLRSGQRALKRCLKSGMRLRNALARSRVSRTRSLLSQKRTTRKSAGASASRRSLQARCCLSARGIAGARRCKLNLLTLGKGTLRPNNRSSEGCFLLIASPLLVCTSNEEKTRAKKRTKREENSKREVLEQRENKLSGHFV
jgi:hypothetical protein